MRFQRKQSNRQTIRVVINLAAMIDVSFLLLFYFLVTWSLADAESRLDSGLQVQSQSSGDAPDFQPQIVDVMVQDGRPVYRVGDRIFADKESLRDAVEPLNKEIGLFVRVEPGPTAGFVVAAIQVGHDAGFRKVTYVAAE